VGLELNVTIESCYFTAAAMFNLSTWIHLRTTSRLELLNNDVQNVLGHCVPLMGQSEVWNKLLGPNV
jgi:hypothetical protein